MKYTKDDRKELDRKRGLIREAIQRCDLRGFDARPLLRPYADICTILWSIGGSPKIPVYCDPANWETPDKWKNQHENKNPVIGVDSDFNIIRKKTPAQMNPRKKTIEKHIEVVSQVPQKTSSTSPQLQQFKEQLPQAAKIGYYKINISWTEQNGSNQFVVEKMQQFFEDLGLEKQNIHELNTGTCVEKTIEYQFKGTRDGYMMLKRTAMAVLDILHSGDEFKVVVHGKPCNEN